MDYQDRLHYWEEAIPFLVDGAYHIDLAGLGDERWEINNPQTVRETLAKIVSFLENSGAEIIRDIAIEEEEAQEAIEATQDSLRGPL